MNVAFLRFEIQGTSVWRTLVIKSIFHKRAQQTVKADRVASLIEHG
jgi:hypothetical protein